MDLYTLASDELIESEVIEDLKLFNVILKNHRVTYSLPNLKKIQLETLRDNLYRIVSDINHLIGK